MHATTVSSLVASVNSMNLSGTLPVCLLHTQYLENQESKLINSFGIMSFEGATMFNQVDVRKLLTF